MKNNNEADDFLSLTSLEGSIAKVNFWDWKDKLLSTFNHSEVHSLKYLLEGESFQANFHLNLSAASGFKLIGLLSAFRIIPEFTPEINLNGTKKVLPWSIFDYEFSSYDFFPGIKGSSVLINHKANYFYHLEQDDSLISDNLEDFYDLFEESINSFGSGTITGISSGNESDSTLEPTKVYRVPKGLEPSEFFLRVQNWFFEDFSSPNAKIEITSFRKNLNSSTLPDYIDKDKLKEIEAFAVTILPNVYGPEQLKILPKVLICNRLGRQIFFNSSFVDNNDFSIFDLLDEFDKNFNNISNKAKIDHIFS